MAKSISDGIFELTGKKATSSEIQKLMAIASAMNIKQDDPMMMIFMVLEHYNGLYSAAPDRIKQTVNDTAKDAVTNAGAAVNQAVAGLVPAVEQAVSNAAKTAMIRVQVGASMITISLGFVILAMVYVLGYISGSGVKAAFDTKLLTISQFFEYTGLNIAIGLVIIATTIMSKLWIEDDDKKMFGWIAAAAVATFSTMLLTNLIIFAKHSL